MILRVIELFAGIGTQRMALCRLGIEHDVVAISEIDKYAIKSYEAIHGEVLNLGDITQIKEADVPDCDLITYSFPCQDISLAGKQQGLSKDSNTRSSLLWECERLIRAKRPKYLLMENVKNLVGKKFIPHYEEWLGVLESLGYTNYWQVLNAKDYGVPQNRERVFCVSILGEHESYSFPGKQVLTTRLHDILEENVDEKFFLSDEQVSKIQMSPYNTTRDKIQHKKWCDALCARDYKDPKCVRVKQIGRLSSNNREDPQRYRVYESSGLAPTLNTAQGGGRQPLIIDEMDSIGKLKNKKEFGRMGKQAAETYNARRPKHGDTINPFNKTISSNDGVSPTLTTRPEGFKTAIILVEKQRIRKLTHKECWRLMGIDDKDFEKAQEVNSNSQLYKQAGNAIVVDVLEAIFKNLFDEVRE